MFAILRKKGFIHLNTGFPNYSKSHLLERLDRVFSSPTVPIWLSTRRVTGLISVLLRLKGWAVIPEVSFLHLPVLPTSIIPI